MAEGIDRDEFTQWMNLIRSDVQGVHTRLDTLNGRTRAVESKIAVMEDRGMRDGGARWGAIGSGVGAAIAAGIAWFKG